MIREPGIIHFIRDFLTGVRNFGLYNVLEGIVLTKFSWFWNVVQAVPPMRSYFNRALINHAVYKVPTRPNRLSTKTDYTSWDSLNDRTYSGRHLPPHISEKALPPASEVAKLFERPNGEMKPGKSTVLFTYFAQWFTESFLRTDYYNSCKNTSNHDMDLSNLYGLTSKETDILREKEGGRLRSQIIDGEEYPPSYYLDDGQPDSEFQELQMSRLIYALKGFGAGQADPKLKERAEMFAGFDKVLKRDPLDPKMFAMGGDRTNSNAGFSAMNTLFLREHNRICGVLQTQNPAWDDDRLFQTARNILIAVLGKIVIEEYINHITPYQFQFQFKPGQFENQRWYRMNWMSVEFNMLYRWHALTPDDYVLDGKTVPLLDTLFWNELVIERGLGPFLEDASKQRAGRISVFNTPRVLVPVEEGTIKLGRACRLKPYNDYRELCQAPRVKSFEQISTDETVQERLKDLYGTVDQVEYYAGIFSEDIIGSTVVPYLIGRLVSVDAFSQALTNPLLSARIFGKEVFTPRGLEILDSTHSLQDLLNRNVPAGKGPYQLTMTYVDSKPAAS